MARIAGRVFQAIVVSPGIDRTSRADGKTLGCVAGSARALILIIGLWLAAAAISDARAQAAAPPAAAPATSTPAAPAPPVPVPAAPTPATPMSYEVTGIRVDVTAENAAAARDKALQDGARQALQQFVDTWVPADKRARYARMSQQQIEDMISDFSIREEKSSSVRYIATLDYRFKPSRASRLLRDAGVAVPLMPGEAPPPPPIIVVPVLEASIPGSGGDPWRSSWRNLAARWPDRYVVASTDTASLAGDQARLSALVRRMGGESGLVVVATPATNAEGGLASLNVGFLRQGRSRQASGQLSFSPEEGETTEAFMRRTVTGTEAAMREAWKQAAAAALPSRAELAAWVPVDSLGDWLKMQKALRQVEGVRRVDLTMMTRRQMLVSLSYTGSLDELRANLEDADLILFEAEGRQVISPDTSPLVPVIEPEASPQSASQGQLPGAAAGSAAP
jgi:hypothetical protein